MQFVYHNHRGQTETRTVTPIALLFISDPAAVSPHLASYSGGWFLECITHDRSNDLRHFALASIINWVVDGEDAPNPVTLRLSLPSGDEFPYDPTSADAAAYDTGWGAGFNGGQFDFARATKPNGSAWARGYNEGRRQMLETNTSIEAIKATASEPFTEK